MCNLFEEDGFDHHCLYIEGVERLHLRERREGERERETQRERKRVSITCIWKVSRDSIAKTLRQMVEGGVRGRAKRGKRKRERERKS